jgi:hypothetical protein
MTASARAVASPGAGIENRAVNLANAGLIDIAWWPQDQAINRRIVPLNLQPGRNLQMTNSLFVTTCICVIFFMTAAAAQLGRPTESRPATTKDLAGKKICWNSGTWGLYGASGDYLDNRGRHPKWSIAEPGVVKIGVSYSQLEVLPDGTFYMHSFCGLCGSITGHHEYWGTVCN